MRNLLRRDWLIDLMSLGGLVFVVFYPLITSFTSLLFGSSTVQPVCQVMQDAGLGRVIYYVLVCCDSGGQMDVAAGALRCAVLLAALGWFLVPREGACFSSVEAVSCGTRTVRTLVAGAACFLVLSLASSCFGGHVRESLTDWLDQCGYVLSFVVAAGLSARWLRSARSVMSLVALFQAIAFVVAVNAWPTFVLDVTPASVMSGSFFQPNMLASFLLILLPLVMVPLWRMIADRRDVDSSSARGGKFALYALLLCCLCATIFLTYNRGGWATAVLLAMLVLAVYPSGLSYGKLTARCLGAVFAMAGIGAGGLLWVRGEWLLAVTCFAVGVALSYWLAVGSRPVAKRVAFVALLLLVVAAGLWKSLPSNDTSSAYAQVRVQTLASGQDNSATARGHFYMAAMRIAWDHPWLGVGPDGFYRAYPLYQSDFRWFAKSPHCLTLELLSEYGFPATIVFFVTLFCGIVVVLRLAAFDDEERRCSRIACLLSVVALLCHAQFDVDFDFVTLPLFAAILAGIAIGMPTSRELEAVTPADTSAHLDDDQLSSWSIHPGMLVQYGFSILLAVALYISSWMMVGEYFCVCGGIAEENHLSKEALTCYMLATEADPYHCDYGLKAAVLLLSEYEKSENPDLLKDLDKRSQALLVLDSQRASIVNLRGRVLELQERWDEAELCYRKALALDPVNDPSAYSDLARSMIRQGKTSEAMALIDAAIEKFPEDAFAQMFDFRSDAVRSELSELYVNKALLYRVGDPLRLQALLNAYRLDDVAVTNRFLLGVECLAVGDIVSSGGPQKRDASIFYHKARTLLAELYQQGECGEYHVAEMLKVANSKLRKTSQQ